MAKAKTKSRGTSATWVMIRGGLPYRSDDPAAPDKPVYQCKDGDEVWTDMQGQPIKDPEVEVLRYFPVQEER